MNQLHKLLSYLSLPGREEEARVLLLALISKQHVVLISPPGTAKSLLIQTTAKLFNVQYFQYLLTKFTMPEELFGVPNIKLLRERGVYEVITTNKLPEAKLAFLDEIFKGSSAILNTLLSILNERVFFNGSKVVKCPLWTLMGASNEVPTEPELMALYDRFQYRHFYSYLPPEKWEQLLNTYWLIHQPSYNKSLPKLDWSIIEETHRKLWTVDWSPIKDKLLEVFMKLRDQKVEISDRRKGRCLISIASNAVLNGRSTATPEDLLVLKYTIPSTKEEVQLVEQVLSEVVSRELKAKLQLRELIPQLEALIQQVEKSSSLEQALKVAEQIKAIHSKVTQLKPLVEDTEEYQRVEQLIQQFSKVLVKKVSL